MFQIYAAEQFRKRFFAERESKYLSFTDPFHVIHHITVLVKGANLLNRPYFPISVFDLVPIQKSMDNLSWIIKHRAVSDMDPFFLALCGQNFGYFSRAYLGVTWDIVDIKAVFFDTCCRYFF